MTVSRVRGAVMAVVLGGTVGACTGPSVTSPPEPVPSPADRPSPTARPTQAGEPVPRGPSELAAVTQVGTYGLQVAGETIPGRWQLQASRRDVWVAIKVGAGDRETQWWGQGTSVRPMPASPGGVLRGGVVISPDARWIAWTRQEGADTKDPSRVMEVVNTKTGNVRWSRVADRDAPELGALAVTNDGVVVFAHCTRPVVDSGGWPQCDAARVDVWAPEVDVTSTVPAAVSASNGPPGGVTWLRPLVQASGAQNGFLVRRDESGPPSYVRVSERGGVDLVARLPRDTMVVTEDERYALAGGCQGSAECQLIVMPLDGGRRRPMKVPTGNMLFEGFAHLVAERGEMVVVQSRPGVGLPPALARCSLAQARCVRIVE